MTKRIVTMVVFLVAMLLSGHIHGETFSEQALMDAYLRQDMSTWRRFLDSQNWDQLNTAERSRVLFYEYGYVAAIIDAKQSDAKQRLATYRRHIEAHQAHLTQARYNVYLSAANAYEYKLDKSKLLSCGWQAYKLAQKAAKQDPNDPLTQTLEGNVLFYAPSVFGGDKEEAIKYFRRAVSLYRRTADYTTNWSYAATRLCIAQCYDQLKDNERAKSECRAILQEFPDFIFVSKTLLPQLIRKQK